VDGLTQVVSSNDLIFVPWMDDAMLGDVPEAAATAVQNDGSSVHCPTPGCSAAAVGLVVVATDPGRSARTNGICAGCGISDASWRPKVKQMRNTRRKGNERAMIDETAK